MLRSENGNKHGTNALLFAGFSALKLAFRDFGKQPYHKFRISQQPALVHLDLFLQHMIHFKSTACRNPMAFVIFPPWNFEVFTMETIPPASIGSSARNPEVIAKIWRFASDEFLGKKTVMMHPERKKRTRSTGFVGDVVKYIVAYLVGRHLIESVYESMMLTYDNVNISLLTLVVDICWHVMSSIKPLGDTHLLSIAQCWHLMLSWILIQ